MSLEKTEVNEKGKTRMHADELLGFLRLSLPLRFWNPVRLEEAGVWRPHFLREFEGEEGDPRIFLPFGGLCVTCVK